MANTNILPFGQSAVMPAGYPIADNLTTNSAQQALSAKQGKLLGDELHTLKILSVGNSFSRDSLSYVPIILKRLGINVEIGILYRSSCTLQMHWEHGNDANYYTFDYFSLSANKWQPPVSKTLDGGISYADWDIVVLQEASGRSGDYTYYQPYLNQLIDYIAGKIGHDVVFAWNQTHAWAVGHQSIADVAAMQSMEANIKVAADRVLAETAVSLMLPYGRAIHYARQNDILKAIGDGGNLCYSDYVHLQEGIGCQCAAYANALALLRFLHSKKGIVGDTLTVDSTFLANYAIPEQHGSAAGSTAANRLIAQRCAVMANNEY
jgi:hypothetical protein